MRAAKLLAATAAVVVTIAVTGADSQAAKLRRAYSGGAQVFLLRGFADVFSAGMDTMAARLQQRGVSARFASHADVESLADEVAANYKAGARGPVIIVGHSFGADAAVRMAQRLNGSGVPVALVVSFGPVASLSVTPNVARAINYYQANSSWHGQISAGPGFHGSLTNINLDSRPGVNHFNIDKIDRLQSDTINRIVAASGVARRPVASHHRAKRAMTAASGDTK